MRLFRHRFNTMGCPAEICLYAENQATAGAAFADAETEVHRLDLKYSHYRTDSTLAEFQRLACRPSGWTADAETTGLLDFAQTQFEASGGRFDITAGRLSALWDQRSTLPSNDQIAAALELTGWQKASWDGANLHLPAGMRLDFGGIVKEYAADRAALVIRALGITHGYVDLGGDLHVLGPHPDGRAWRIGIRHPRQKGSAVAAIDVLRGGLATSGDYERCSMIEGKRYSHLIDAVTGWPVQGLVTASVTAPSCLLAGAMSTLAMLLGREAGLELLQSSGLGWLAHDGSFSFSNGNCKLPETPGNPSIPHQTRSDKTRSQRSQRHVPVPSV